MQAIADATIYPAAPGRTDTRADSGMIGPNAITRIAEAVEAVEGRSAVVDLFHLVALDAMLAEPPTAMVPERAVTALQQALTAKFGAVRASTLSWIAGQRTADYLLAHRIPRRAQTLLAWLPAALAARALLKAVQRHAWTFAGSGQFEVHYGPQLTLTLQGCPICRGQRASAPVCSYYAGTFERLFRQLVHANARCTEFACEALGAEKCQFRLVWQTGSDSRRAGKEIATNGLKAASIPGSP